MRVGRMGEEDSARGRPRSDSRDAKRDDRFDN